MPQNVVYTPPMIVKPPPVTVKTPTVSVKMPPVTAKTPQTVVKTQPVTVKPPPSRATKSTSIYKLLVTGSVADKNHDLKPISSIAISDDKENSN